MKKKLQFEWDEAKNAVNIMKHGVSFEEAKMAFFDPLRVDLFDHAHSGNEDRWKVFGMYSCTLLMVSYTEIQGRIRMISARKATKQEEEAYFYGYDTSYSN
jgi:uncharacterized DUF497 family protein